MTPGASGKWIAPLPSYLIPSSLKGGMAIWLPLVFRKKSKKQPWFWRNRSCGSNSSLKAGSFRKDLSADQVASTIDCFSSPCDESDLQGSAGGGSKGSLHSRYTGRWTKHKWERTKHKWEMYLESCQRHLHPPLNRRTCQMAALPAWHVIFVLKKVPAPGGHGQGVFRWHQATGHFPESCRPSAWPIYRRKTRRPSGRSWRKARETRGDGKMM